MTDQQNSPIIPEDVTESVRETMQGYGNAASDGRQWNIYLAMRFAETAVLADRSRRAKAPAQATELAPDVKGLVERDLERLSRDIGVAVVDALHGYTVELAPSPPAHRDEYLQAQVAARRELDQVLSRLSAPPAEAKPEAWSVKPLEWLKVDPNWHEADARGVNLTYQTWPEAGEGWVDPTMNGMRHGSLDKAKAAAQADYEQRILSALVLHPDPRAKAAEAVPEGMVLDAARLEAAIDAAELAFDHAYRYSPPGEGVSGATQDGIYAAAETAIRTYLAAAPQPLSPGEVK